MAAPATVPLVKPSFEFGGHVPDNRSVCFIPDDRLILLADSRIRERAALGLIGEDGQETRKCLEQFMEKRGSRDRLSRAREIPVLRSLDSSGAPVGAGRVFGGRCAGQ